MASQIQLRRGIKSLWVSVNPVLAEGELGLETDTFRIKLGDGVTAWNSLHYVMNTLLHGSGVPTSDIGVDGDFYFSYSATYAILYSKNAGVWDSGTNLIAGASLSDNVFTGNQDLADHFLLQAVMKDCSLAFVDKGNSGTTTQTFDYTAGSIQRVRATGNFAITLSNFPPSGYLGEIMIELVADGSARTITWPTINWIKSDGSLTTSFSANGISLQTVDGSIDWVMLWTRDGGTTIYGKIIR